MNEWVIYALRNDEGELFYVGFSRDHNRRLKEHRTTYGRNITIEVLQRGSGGRDSWSEHEKRWIKDLRSLGYELTNIAHGGTGMGVHSEETKSKLSAIFRNRPMTWGGKISAATKGKPHNWTEEGKRKSSQHHFTKGTIKSPEIESRRKTAQKIAMKNMSPEKRTARMRKANKTWWSTATSEERSERTKKMIGARDKTKVAEACRKAREAQQADPELRKKFGNRIKNFWSNMTPEYRAEYLARRTESIRAAWAAKRTLSNKKE